MIDTHLPNQTRETNDNVRLKCEFRGHPLPAINWFKNEAPVEQEKGKMMIRQNILSGGRVRSRLFINHLDTHDTGYYKCEATNEAGTVESVGVLLVNSGEKREIMSQIKKEIKLADLRK